MLTSLKEESRLSIERMFLHEKTVGIMLRILEAEENGTIVYPLSLSRDVKSPYSYISKVLSELEKNGLIESEVKGRVRVIRLTETGRKIAEILRNLRNELRKDFVSRKKIETLKKFIRNLSNEVKTYDDALRALAPIKVELKMIKEKTNDSEIIKIVKELEKKVDGILEKFS